MSLLIQSIGLWLCGNQSCWFGCVSSLGLGCVCVFVWADWLERLCNRMFWEALVIMSQSLDSSSILCTALLFQWRFLTVGPIEQGPLWLPSVMWLTASLVLWKWKNLQIWTVAVIFLESKSEGLPYFWLQQGGFQVQSGPVPQPLPICSVVNRHCGVDEGVVLADQVYFSDLCRLSLSHEDISYFPVPDSVLSEYTF